MIFALLAAVAMALPPSWWEQTKGVSIVTPEQLDELLLTKVVLLDFYMEQCQWCYLFQQEWNALADDFRGWFGD